MNSLIETSVTEIQTFRYADIEYLLAETDPQALYAKIIAHLQQQTQADRGAFVVLRNRQPDTGYCKTAHDDAQRVTDEQLNGYFPQPMVDYVINMGEVVCYDTHQDEVLAAFKMCQEYNLRSFYATTLSRNGVALGMVLLGSTQVGHFDARQDAIRQFVSLATLALYNTYIMARQQESLMQTHEELRAQHEQIEQQAKVLAEQSRDLLDSMLYASRIQKTLLPDPDQLRVHFADAAVYYKPKDHLGGDFYWWDFRGHYAVLVAADCTGHGIPGAMLSILGINCLNQLISEVGTDDAPDPARLLGLLNFRLTCTLQPDDSAYKILDGMDIGLAVIDLRNRQLAFSSAQFHGYNMRNGMLQDLNHDRVPVAGQLTGPETDILFRQYSTQRMQLQAGDRLFLASDGFADQFGSQHPDDSRKRKLGRRGLRHLLEQSAVEPLGQLPSLLNIQCDLWRQDQEQTDDILVLGVQL